MGESVAPGTGAMVGEVVTTIYHRKGNFSRESNGSGENRAWGGGRVTDISGKEVSQGKCNAGGRWGVERRERQRQKATKRIAPNVLSENNHNFAAIYIYQSMCVYVYARVLNGEKQISGRDPPRGKNSYLASRESAIGAAEGAADAVEFAAVGAPDDAKDWCVDTAIEPCDSGWTQQQQQQ